MKNSRRFLLPAHWMIPPVFTFVLNSLVYWGAPILAAGRHHYNLSGPMDELIPFMPQFILVYFGCYIFWVINYCIIARQEKEHRYRFYTADFYARLVCLLCFVLFPTTNTRPIVSGSSVWSMAVRFLYRLDAPVNLFPSIHCMASWFCYIGIRNLKNIPEWYKRFSLVVALMVFVSTLALRQHVLPDVAGGILVAEVTLYISRHTNGYRVYERITERVGDTFLRLCRKGRRYER